MQLNKTHITVLNDALESWIDAHEGTCVDDLAHILNCALETKDPKAIIKAAHEYGSALDHNDEIKQLQRAINIYYEGKVLQFTDLSTIETLIASLELEIDRLLGLIIEDIDERRVTAEKLVAAGQLYGFLSARCLTLSKDRPFNQ